MTFQKEMSDEHNSLAQLPMLDDESRRNFLDSTIILQLVYVF